MKRYIAIIGILVAFAICGRAFAGSGDYKFNSVGVGTNPSGTAGDFVSTTVKASGLTGGRYVQTTTGGLLTTPTGQPVPACTILSGASPTMTPANTTDPVKECFTEVLSANTTLTSFASGAAPTHMWTAHLILTQPSGGHNYTFAFSAGSGESITYMATGGCASLPTMPTSTGKSLLLDIVYNTNPSSPTIDVVSCPTDG